MPLRASISAAAGRLASARRAATDLLGVLLEKHINLPEVLVGIGRPGLVCNREAARGFLLLQLDLDAVVFQPLPDRFDVGDVFQLDPEMPVAPDRTRNLPQDQRKMGV